MLRTMRGTTAMLSSAVRPQRTSLLQRAATALGMRASYTTTRGLGDLFTHASSPRPLLAERARGTALPPPVQGKRFPTFIPTYDEVQALRQRLGGDNEKIQKFIPDPRVAGVPTRPLQYVAPNARALGVNPLALQAAAFAWAKTR